LAAFGVDHNHRLAVFEMAMNRRGEIAELADIVRPQIALITNIGTAHSGLVGSQDQIAYEKKQIFREFLDSHRGILYEDEPYRGFLAQALRGNVLYYGPENTPALESVTDLGIDGHRIVLAGEEIHVRLPGRFNLLNALAAIRIAQLVGCSVREIKEGLEAMEPAFGRGQILRGAVTVLQDAYNANPESMRSAIRFMSDLPWTGKKIIVLGAMKELGNEGEDQHLDIASLAAAMEPHRLFLFGEEFREAGEALERSGSGDQVLWTREFTELAEELTETARSGDIVLLKGSRSMELERLVPYLQEGEG
jgi:UDP-N-acetylmuramoyl-tripeptide--D-alanyl-D-alanine ligase